VTPRFEARSALGALSIFALAAQLGCGARGPATTPETLANGVLLPAAAAPPLGAHVTGHVAGDSTAAIFSPTDPTARVGWAAVLQQFFAEGVEGLGPLATVPLFASSDKTHLSAQGAPQVGALVAQGVRELRLPLADRLAPSAR
jgi:hypothetical protein